MSQGNTLKPDCIYFGSHSGSSLQQVIAVLEAHEGVFSGHLRQAIRSITNWADTIGGPGCGRIWTRGAERVPVVPHEMSVDK